MAVAGLSLVPAYLGPQLPWVLSAGSIATSGGRTREPQLRGPAAPRPQQGGQVRLADRAFPSQGPAVPDQHFSSANLWPSLTASNKQGSPVRAGKTFILNGACYALSRLLSATMTMAGGREGWGWQNYWNPLESAGRGPRLQNRWLLP